MNRTTDAAAAEAGHLARVVRRAMRRRLAGLSARLVPGGTPRRAADLFRLRDDAEALAALAGRLLALAAPTPRRE